MRDYSYNPQAAGQERTSQYIDGLQQQHHEAMVDLAGTAAILGASNYVISRGTPSREARQQAPAAALRARRTGVWLWVLAGLLVLPAFAVGAGASVFIGLAIVAGIVAVRYQSRGLRIIRAAQRGTQ